MNHCFMSEFMYFVKFKGFLEVLTLLNGTVQYDMLVLHQYFLFQRCS